MNALEKLKLQKTVREKANEIQHGGLSALEKLKAQKDMREALQALKAGIDTGKTSKTLESMLAGEYDSLPPLKFLAMMEKTVNELGGDIEPIKEPTIKYVAANKDKIDPIMESALIDIAQPNQGFFGMGMGRQKQPVSSVWCELIDENNPQGPRIIHIDVDHEFYEPEMFRERIRALEMAKNGDEAVLKINSPGGRTDAAQAFYVALLETKAKTKAKVIKAASSGSIIAMACDEIVLTPFCDMMIHNASGGAHGKVSDMAASSMHYKEFFREWFDQLYSGFMTSEEISDIVKGQEFYLKECDIRERLKNWTPIRKRIKKDSEGDTVFEGVKIKVKHPGILNVPEGKSVQDLNYSHFKILVDEHGFSAISKALVNLEVWNKENNPDLSMWAKNMRDKLAEEFGN